MPELFTPVGSQEIYNAGVEARYQTQVIAAKMLRAPNGNIYALNQSLFQPTSNNAAVPIGNSFTLIAAQARSYQLVTYLSFEANQAGSVQLLDNGVVVLDFTLVANVPRPVELFEPGLLSAAQNTAITVKNNTGAIATIKVNFSFVYVGA